MCAARSISFSFHAAKISVIDRSLPAVTTSLCLLATPVLGIFSAMLSLAAPPETSLFLAMTLIIGGIALGTVITSLRAQAP